MPFVEVPSRAGDGPPLRIFYVLRGNEGGARLLMLQGFAADHHGWDSNFADLDKDYHICAIDNRGIGQSSAPVDPSEYTTDLMAQDAFCVMDAVGWDKAHCAGHSMGAMVVMKMVAMHPQRVLSASLLSVTGGGLHAFPPLTSLWLFVKIALFGGDLESRAKYDLSTHYTERHLNERVESSAHGRAVRRWQLLHEKYVATSKSGRVQAPHGFWGHCRAVWYHKLTHWDLEKFRRFRVPTQFIHGDRDPVARLSQGRRLARLLEGIASWVPLFGSHFVHAEATQQVNQRISNLIMKAMQHNNELRAAEGLPMECAEAAAADADAEGSASLLRRASEQQWYYSCVIA